MEARGFGGGGEQDKTRMGVPVYDQPQSSVSPSAHARERSPLGMESGGYSHHTTVENDTNPNLGFSFPSNVEYDSRSLNTTGRRRPERPYDIETLASTRSLYDRDLEYELENSRRYVSDYYLPNDESEQDRLLGTHHAYLFIFNGALTTVPLDNPERLLDVGTGIGQWAIDMGELHPDADVVGTDISAIQPTSIPPNVYFEIDDAENENGWTHSRDSFDLVHFRNMRGSFSDWEWIYAQALQVLKPGAWMEVIDWDDDRWFATQFPPESRFHTYLAALNEAAVKAGRPRSIAHLDPDLLVRCGFGEVGVRDLEIPLGMWPENRQARGIARLFLVITLESFEAVSMRLLTKEMGWDVEEVKSICADIGRELKTMALDRESSRNLCVRVKVLTARRPIDPSSSGNSQLAIQPTIEALAPSGSHTFYEEDSGRTSGHEEDRMSIT